MSFLEVAAVGHRSADAWIANDIHFSQEKLQNIAIAGETGSGKSTVLKMIAGLVQPHTGQILFEGERIAGPEEKLIPGHMGIAYLSQVFELPKFLRVGQVLQYANKLPDTDAQSLFEICRINHLLKRRTNELSGGEQQRIALARLLIMRPKLLLLDEPFSNLDLIHKSILKAVLLQAQRQLKLSMILTSHDPLDTLTWAHTVGVLKAGKIVQWGTPQQVYQQPVSEYVAGLFGSYNLLEPVVAKALLPNAIQKDSKLLVRPEDLSIAPVAQKGTIAIVASTRFAGAFYETDVWIEHQLLTIQTNIMGWKKGDIVTVSLSPAHVWHLSN